MYLVFLYYQDRRYYYSCYQGHFFFSFFLRCNLKSMSPYRVAPAPLSVRDAACSTCGADTALFKSDRGAPGAGGSAAVPGAAVEIRGAWTSLAGAIVTWRLLCRGGCVGSRGRVPGALGSGPASGVEERAPA
ncbi:hypothetical protein NDU88_004416 [Pleurodeles waltl]|uniref:Uncharacterized protein n=1 Tax=Pleurodeles waltl TaxID=8319 RepID=A0AAV7NJC0_PLEWA|nr:hypothetical protein NDU88_004416 [Pleurodeles waltl]